MVKSRRLGKLLPGQREPLPARIPGFQPVPDQVHDGERPERAERPRVIEFVERRSQNSGHLLWYSGWFPPQAGTSPSPSRPMSTLSGEAHDVAATEVAHAASVPHRGRCA